jgi:hypothetical protein
MTERDDLSGASISPREQLRDIRAILERMDGKLDGKADGAYVGALEQRIRLLEVGGGDRVVEIRARVEQVDAGLQTLARKLAYATGTLSMVVVAVNAVTVWFINH